MVQIAIWTFLRAIPHRQELDNLFSRHQRDREYKHLQLRYLYLEGRYFIRSGEYQKGFMISKSHLLCAGTQAIRLPLRGLSANHLLLHSNGKYL